MGNQATERYGYAGAQGYDTSGRSPIEKGNLDPSLTCVGVVMQPMRPFKIYPLSASTSNLATSQDPATTVTLTAGTGVTATTLNVNGVNVSVFDITGQGALAVGTNSDVPMTVERSVTVTGAGTTAFTVTVVGYDQYKQAVTCSFPGPSSGVALTSESRKTFSYVTSVTVSADPGVNITVGTGDTYGFPVKVARFDHLLYLFWNDTVINGQGGFTQADDTSPTTVLTGNVRGSYKLQNQISNGTTALSCYIWLPNTNNMDKSYGIVP